MISDVKMRLALRSKAMTLSVATTGSITMSATATGYARTAGSFIDDGLAEGMEVIVAGFANNGPAVLTSVSDLTVRARRVIASTANGVTTYTLVAPPVESAAAGRSLTVGLPSQRAWMNKDFEPTAGIPWVHEEFSSGPSTQRTIGPFGTLIAEPQYTLHVSVPAGTGLTPVRYVDALRVLFAHRTEIQLSNGDWLRVRADTGPYVPGSELETQPGFVALPFVVPLRLETQNII